MSDTAQKFCDKQIGDALRETRGNLTATAALLEQKYNIPCERSYIKRATITRNVLIEIVQELRETVVDKAEDVVFNLVDAGDDKASYFILRTLGKDRGYVPKEEVDGKLDASALIEAIQAGRARARDEKKTFEDLMYNKNDGSTVAAAMKSVEGPA